MNEGFVKDVKVYFDGGHFIGIPKELQPWKRQKKPPDKEPEQDSIKDIFNKVYDDNKDKKKAEKTEIVLTEMKKYLDEETAKQVVKENFDRKLRNYLERRKRLMRKVRQQNWNYFCTFTYDDKLHTEETFRKTLSNCLRHLASRKQWRYIGVWERSPENNRLHFHGLFVIPQMIGEFIELKDYSTKNHQMQTTIQNSFFLKRFGRNDFSPIVHQSMLDQSIKYLMKYIEKSGEKIVYSKGLYTYFVTDILEEDIVCPIGVENRKILLFDNFKCLDIETGEYFGEISYETKEKLRKSN